MWDLGDVGIGLMTIINLIILVPMSKESIAILDKKEDIAEKLKEKAKKNKLK